jgi:hypothetical protein
MFFVELKSAPTTKKSSTQSTYISVQLHSNHPDMKRILLSVLNAKDMGTPVIFATSHQEA